MPVKRCPDCRRSYTEQFFSSGCPYCLSGLSSGKSRRASVNENRRIVDMILDDTFNHDDRNKNSGDE